MEGIKKFPRKCAQKPRKRQEADVSAEYHQVLIDLRAAYIAMQEDRILELSEQLDELAEDEEPDLDDAVEITEAARKDGHWMTHHFSANDTLAYLTAYGKDFPAPWTLVYRNAINRKGPRPTPEEWQEIRAFLIEEMSLAVAGLDVKKQEKVGAQVAALVDRASSLDKDQLKKEWGQGGKLKAMVSKITAGLSPFQIMEYVVERDLAEWMSNPRALPAIEARLLYLKK
jgi:hypothetical protein